MMALAKKTLLLAALVALAFVGASRADDLYNNLGAAGNGADSTGSVWGPLADSFSTGSSAFEFDSLTVLLEGTPSSGTTTAYLLSDSSTSPGTPLKTIGSFSESSLTFAAAPYSLTTNYVLSPDTRYWIELTSDDNSANWQWSFDTSGTGVAGEDLANFQGGDSWTVFPNDNGPYQMEVAGTAVAEPGTVYLSLVGLGLFGLFSAIRKKRLNANTPDVQ
jgi:PEP-CTERM motif